jgi:3-hydroxyacyl-[acyl-carrier-protein] dehydratase
MSDTHLSAMSASPAARGVSKEFTPDQEGALRESLRRCSEKTIEAAISYQQAADPKHIPVIVIGIFERFVEPDLRPRLAGDSDELRVIEDLGLDSLTMMEIVMLVEEVTQTKIENDELRGLVTIGDIKTFVDCRARGVTPPAPAKALMGDELRAIMPISAPFLFLDDARISPVQATASYRITGQEFFLAGHFKNNPVMPASIMLEALGQLGVLHLLSGLPVDAGKVVGAQTIFFASTDGVRCSRVCKPGDVLTLTLKPKRIKEPLAVYTGSIRVGQEKAVIAEEITLTFGVVDAPVVAAPAEPAA